MPELALPSRLGKCTNESRNIWKRQDWTHLRPTGFMQEYLREAPSITQQSALFFALGDTKLNPVDLTDVAKAGYLLLRDGGRTGECLPMTGPESLTAETQIVASAVELRLMSAARPRIRRQVAANPLLRARSETLR
jgi:uncharacterized protein YbjT (DUF2867 family)